MLVENWQFTALLYFAGETSVVTVKNIFKRYAKDWHAKGSFPLPFSTNKNKKKSTHYRVEEDYHRTEVEHLQW